MTLVRGYISMTQKKKFGIKGIGIMSEWPSLNSFAWNLKIRYYTCNVERHITCKVVITRICNEKL